MTETSTNQEKELMTSCSLSNTWLRLGCTSATVQGHRLRWLPSMGVVIVIVQLHQQIERVNGPWMAPAVSAGGGSAGGAWGAEGMKGSSIGSRRRRGAAAGGSKTAARSGDCWEAGLPAHMMILYYYYNTPIQAIQGTHDDMLDTNLLRHFAACCVAGQSANHEVL